MTNETHWYKSSYSSNGGDCVEIAANLVAAHGTVPVRDSKSPSGPVLNFRADAFSSFTSGIKTGELGSV